MKQPFLYVALFSVLGLARLPAANVDFVKDIAPIFEQRCIECHGPEKQKGKLRLDQKDALLKAKEPLVVAGSADKSEIIRLISLPKGHDDIMPNKGEPLTKAQIDLIRDWINQGAAWPDNFVVGAAVAPKTSGGPASDLRAAAAELRSAAARLETAAAALEGGTPTAPVVERKPTPEELAAFEKAKEGEKKFIAEIEKSGVSVRPIALNVDWKEANFRTQGTNVTDATIAPLKGVFTLIDLNLAGTKITDAGLAPISGLSNLATLHLENTGVTDAGLPHLKGLAKLEYLNLYNTAVTDAGLEHLKSLKNLKKLYLWQSKVTEDGAKNLQAALPRLQISRGVELALVKKEDTAEAEKKAKEAQKVADDAAKAEAEKKTAAEVGAKKKAEDEKKAEEKKAADEAAKKEAEKKAAEEAAKKESDKKAADTAEAAKKAADDAAKKAADAKAQAEKKPDEKKPEEKKPEEKKL